MTEDPTTAAPGREDPLARRQAELAVRLGSGSPLDLTDGTLVVVPSLTLREEELRKITGIQFYEERLLFTLLLLRSPDLRVVFVTSVRVEEPIVDYYLRFIPEELRAGDRLYLIALWDPQPKPLTEKLLGRDEALDRLKTLASGDSCLLAFNVTDSEKALAERIDVPLYGCPPHLVSLGFKSGSRKVARAAGVPVLEGSEDLSSLGEVEDALRALRIKRPDAKAAVIKCNEGFSGQGNAIVDLTAMHGSLRDAPITFCAEGEDWTSFEHKVLEEGAIVEELLRVPGMRSPSVQMRIAPDRSYEIVSTHDQILGGPDEQVYLGCSFPADASYRDVIQEAGRLIAVELAGRGVMGAFGIDFVVAPSTGEEPPQIYLSEINLRMGGTTHPFLMARLATRGHYDEKTGELLVDGIAKSYVATDNLKSESYVGLLPEQVVQALDRTGLGFDSATNTGVTLHLLGALKKFGKLGIVAIADSPSDADEMYRGVLEVLDDLAVDDVAVR
jgi:hypothetical protein